MTEQNCISFFPYVGLSVAMPMKIVPVTTPVVSGRTTVHAVWDISVMLVVQVPNVCYLLCGTGLQRMLREADLQNIMHAAWIGL